MLVPLRSYSALAPPSRVTSGGRRTRGQRPKNRTRCPQINQWRGDSGHFLYPGYSYTSMPRSRLTSVSLKPTSGFIINLPGLPTSSWKEEYLWTRSSAHGGTGPVKWTFDASLSPVFIRGVIHGLFKVFNVQCVRHLESSKCWRIRAHFTTSTAPAGPSFGAGGPVCPLGFTYGLHCLLFSAKLNYSVLFL